MSKLKNIELSKFDKLELDKIKRLRNISHCAAITGLSRPTISAIIRRGTALTYQIEALRQYFNQNYNN